MPSKIFLVQVILLLNLLLQLNASTIPVEAIQEGLKLVKEKIIQRSGRDGQEFETELKTKKFKGSYEWTSEDVHFNLDDGTEYIIKEFAHAAFAHLRNNVFGINTAKYLESLTQGQLSGYVNPGRGGSSFFQTSDGRFMLKSLILLYRREHRLLEKNLIKYAQYMERNKNSFLTKYCGVYSIESKNNPKEVMWFFAMPNLVKPQDVPTESLAQIDFRFDIKGHHSTSRVAKGKELEKSEPTLKDYDFNGPKNRKATFPEGIDLADSTYELVVNSIREDANFLANVFHVHDYSLFIGVHFNNAEEEAEAKNAKNENGIISRLSNGSIPGHCVKCHMPKRISSALSSPEAIEHGGVANHGIGIFVGIVDLLTVWYGHNQLGRTRPVLRVLSTKVLDCVIYTKLGNMFKSFVKNQVFHKDSSKAKHLLRIRSERRTVTY